MARATTLTTTPTGLDGLLGGRAKSGIVRALAGCGPTRLSDLVGAVGMSKSAVANAVMQLEQAGAVRTRRDGREVLVEAAEREVFATLLSFDRRVHQEGLVMPVPQEEMVDAALGAVEAFLGEPVAAVAGDSRFHESETGLPVSDDVWKLPGGAPA